MEQPSFNSWTILFLIAAMQGFFLTTLLFLHKKGNRAANTSLAFLILSFSIQMSYYVMFWTGYSRVYVWMNFWIEPLVFLSGPLIYLYIFQLDNRRNPPKWKLHFIPAIAIFIFLIPFILRNIFGRITFLRNYYFLPLNNSIPFILQSFIYLQIASLIFYGFIIYRYFISDQRKLNSFALTSERMKNRWLKRVTFLYAGYAFAFLLYYILAFTKLIKPEYDYFISGCMTLFIYTVGYMGFRQPAIFHEMLPVENNPVPQPTIKMQTIKSPEKYQHSNLSYQQAGEIAEKLKMVMVRDKPFLDNTLTIRLLAEQLEISTHQLSQVINAVLKQTYPDLINYYRIEEAKRLLASPEYKEKILSVAFDVGYSNKATFNIAFKKNTGLSPSDFRKMQLKRDIA